MGVASARANALFGVVTRRYVIVAHIPQLRRVARPPAPTASLPLPMWRRPAAHVSLWTSVPAAVAARLALRRRWWPAPLLVLWRKSARKLCRSARRGLEVRLRRLRCVVPALLARLARLMPAAPVLARRRASIIAAPVVVALALALALAAVRPPRR